MEHGRAADRGRERHHHHRLHLSLGKLGISAALRQGDGVRVAQSIDGVETTWVQDQASGLAQVLLEITDGQTTAYLLGLGRLAQVEDGEWEWFLGDVLGSVRQLVGSDGDVVLAQDYSPVGQPLSESGTGNSKYAFTGEQWNNDVALLFLRARHYAPYLNRFLSLDPIIPDFTKPQSLNGYVYCLNDPVNCVDPAGLQGGPVFEFGPPGGSDPVEWYLWDWYQTGWDDVTTYLGFRSAYQKGIEVASAESHWRQLDPQTIAWTMADELGGDDGWLLYPLLLPRLDWAQWTAAAACANDQQIAAYMQTMMLFAPNLDAYWRISPDTWVRIPNETYPRASLPVLVIDSKKVPQIAAGIEHAQAQGAPKVLTRTTDRVQIVHNRRVATSGFTGPGSPDEYPFASTMEGGSGTFITGVPLSEQRAQGGILSSFYRNNAIGHGGKFIVVVKE